MAGIGAWIWGTSQLDDAIDKATSELLPTGSEDIALNLEICDQIRSKSAPAKDAMRALKRRLNHKNPNVQLLALGLSDVCVKNGGDIFLNEISSREFMDNLVSILKIPALNLDVKNTILRLIQNWSVAFEGKSQLSYVGQVYKTLKDEGFKFPPKDLAVANAAMIDTQTAPEWIDSEVCLRCRTPFSFTNRKHHCRNCGQVFDQACSAKTMALPHFGITQEVRVCDGCYTKLTRKGERVKKESREPTTTARHRPARELEDAELQRAIQLSLQEVNGGHSGYVPSQPSPSKWQVSEPPIVDRSTYPSRSGHTVPDDDEDLELKAAIEASLREANAPKPSAPVAEPPRHDGSQYASDNPTLPALPTIPTYDLDPLETDTILTFNQTVEQVQAQGGRDLSRYPAVTTLYDKATGLRPKMALSMDDAGRKEEILSDMHNKLSEAVKLYDQILTQQVSQPRWRSSVVSPSAASYQPSTNAYRTASYSNPQWAPPVQSQATGSQVYPSPLEQQPQYANSAIASSPPPQWGPQSTPTPSYDTYAPSAPQFSPSIPPASSSQAPQFAPAQTLPPVTFGQPPPSTTQNPQFIPIPQSPPPPTAVESHSTLARHHTVAYSPAPTNASYLNRSNTVASSTYDSQQRFAPSVQQYQQQQQDQSRQSLIASAPAPPTTIPYFPSAPTALPQFSASSAYGVEQKEERKEALLIDL